MRTYIKQASEHDYSDLANLLFPEKVKSLEEIIAKYPDRNLPKGAMVTRIAPSPTGFANIGMVYAGLINKKLSLQSKGVFFLRIEDTDKKREQEGATKLIVDTLREMDIEVDEGVTSETQETGDYGPYTQSKRNDIYHAFVYDLVRRGLAYPCFCTTGELEKHHYEQEEQKVRFGYYKDWAVWRNKTRDEINEALSVGKEFVIRLKSQGDFSNKVTFNDIIKGEIEFPQNDNDTVLLKSDMTPTYHLAHAIDDFLMKTTHVIRGDEWVSSVPLHIELHTVLGFSLPEYGHIAPICISENGAGKRKLSKRKDKEASMNYFFEKGYPTLSVTDYLLNLANSNYEEWREKNVNTSWKDFSFDIEKLKESNAPLFSEVKLQDISKGILSRMEAGEFYDNILGWANNCHEGCKVVLTFDKPYWIRVFSIERDPLKPRKDFAYYSDVPMQYMYFNKMMFLDYHWNEQSFALSKKERISFLKKFIANCNIEWKKY